MSNNMIPEYADFSFMNNEANKEFTDLFNVIKFYNAQTLFTPEKQTLLFNKALVLDLIRNDTRMTHHSSTSLDLILQAIKGLYTDDKGWEHFYYKYINHKMNVEIEKKCYPNTFKKYYYNNVEYAIGELDFNAEPVDLSQYTNKVIVFNDYFSLNEINGDVSIFSTDLCIEIKTLHNFLKSPITTTNSAEFIILPHDYIVSNDTINLVINYISYYLYFNYDKEQVEDYITQVKNTFNGKCDNIKFDQPIIFRLDFGIENLIYTNDESDESQEDEET